MADASVSMRAAERSGRAAERSGSAARGLAVVRKIVTYLAVLLLVSFVTFMLLQIIPGDAALLRGVDRGITDEELRVAREQLGLDRPFYVQYFDWLSSAVRGDFGSSLVNRQPVTELIRGRLPVTITLAIAATCIIVPVSIVLGVLAGAFEGRLIDRSITAWASVAVTVPTFWLGLLLVLFFAVNRSIFPATGYVPFTEGPFECIRHIFLPAVTLALPYAAAVARQLRVSMVDVLNSDYVRAAEARGLTRSVVLFKHALRNAAPPALTLFGLEVIGLIGGSVVVESVFALPGLGDLTLTAVQGRDVPVIMGVILVATVVALIVNLIVDLGHRHLNPRVR